MGDVVNLTQPTKLDGSPQRILDAALEANLKHVVVVGYDQEGNEYFASSYADGANAAWALQRGCVKLLRLPDAAE
jgi:hypothetical protein